MKKNLCLLLISAFLMAVFLMPASASICMEEDFSVLPAGWEKTETNGGTVTLADQKLRLEFDTTTGAATPTARMDTSVISQSGKDFVIRFVSSFLGSDVKANRRLRAGSGSSLVEPFRLAGTDLRIFNTLITPSEENKVSEILDGSSKEITILIRPAQAAACVWLDGAKIFDGGITWNSRIDFSLMQYSFINTGSNIQAASSWELDSLGVFELGEFQLTSTPPDGATFVNASQTNRILLHTGTPFSPSNDLEGIITLKDDSENILPCVVSGGGETIILSPNSPLAGSKTYAVTVTGLTDMDGGVLTKSISFSTAPEGYTPPSVKITSPAQGTQFFAGQCVEVLAEAESAQGVRQVDFYVDGVLTKSFTQPPYRLDLQSLTAKSFQVYAAVTDSNNMTVSSAPVTVAFLENLAPEISFLNLTDGMVCQKSELSAVTLQAQDPDGNIDRVELYLNGQIFGTAFQSPYTFDLSEKSAGIYDVMAVAYDTYGLSSDASLSITIAAKTTEAVIINTNFDDGVPTGVDLRAQNGTINKDYTVDSAHGKSIYVSVGSGVTSSYPNIAFLTNSAGTKYVWEGDLYFEDASVSSSRVELVGTEKSSLFSTIGGTLKLYSAGLSQNAGQLESGRWYHFRADIDTDYQTFDFYWDGEQKASKLPLEKDASDLKEIRLFCNFQGNYVLDNVLLKTVVEEPYITGVTYNGKDTPASVPYDAQTIDILLSAGVQSASVTKDSILLENSFGPVPLESAVFSAPGTIQLTAKYCLLSNEQYTVTLTTGIHSVSGAPLSEPLIYSFTTAKKAVDVADYGFQDTGSTIQFTVKIENTGGEQPVMVVLNIWEGNTLVKSCAVSAKVTKTATLTTPAVNLSSGQRAEAFVISDGGSPLGISGKTFLYQK